MNNRIYILRSSIAFALSVALAMPLAMVLTPNPASAYWPKSMPVCSDQRVLSKIIFRFNKTDRELWQYGVSIHKLSGAHQHAVDPYASLISRRFCHAIAYLSDGHQRKVHFVVERGMGFAGTGWNVEYCLKGSDGWHAYDGWCRVLKY